MYTDINLPEDFNGIEEVGIAANVDELGDKRLHLRVLYTYDTVAFPYLADADAFLSEATRFNTDTVDGKPDFPKGLLTPGICSILGISDVSELKGTMRAVPVRDYQTQARATAKVWLAGTLAVAGKPFTDPDVRALFVSGIAFAVARGWVLRNATGENVSHLNVGDSLDLYSSKLRAGNDPDFITADKVHELLTFPGQILANLIVSTKVSWWLTNHHVGQRPDAIQSYAGKMVSTVDRLNALDKKELRTAIWALGKYVSTCQILACLGIKGITRWGTFNAKDQPMSDFVIRGAEDVSQRIGARPAGSAVVSTYLAGVKTLARTPYAILIPSLDGYEDAVEADGEIAKDPCRYHMGSFFLTGKDRLPCDAFSEDDKLAISSALHVLMPAGQLAKAPVLLPVGECKGSFVYTVLTQARAEVAQLASGGVQRALMIKYSGGKTTGGLALQLGKITIEEVKAVCDAQEAEEKKKSEATGTDIAAGKVASKEGAMGGAKV